MTCIDCDSEKIFKFDDDIAICRDCYIDALNLQQDLEIEDLL